MKSQIFWLLLWLALPLWGQNDFYKNHSFTQADTLRGKLLPERSCYDVHYYQLNIRVNPDEKFLQGQVAIHFTAERDFERLQIDLYREMTIAAISFEDQALDYERRANAVLVNMPRLLLSGEQAVLHITYGGKPQSAVDPPWQEGFVWSEDGRGRPWVGVACEGAGASLWWPCKDHLSDEPDSCQVQVSVPEGLMAVSNGNLQSVDTLGNGYVRYDWRVSYPINNYNITLNIAPYVQFSDHYQMGNGESLALDYYVLPNNLARARRHFRQIPKVLEAFEYYFGPYPFPRDGFAMVDAPFLGMEHQGAIAYGNDYQRGYLGYMALDHMDWDYVIVHETAHEYFGNSISCKDLGEMWIH
ncbi:MAG: M1 family metallopeptidase, partial [Bacteroidota bacterium]